MFIATKKACVLPLRSPVFTCTRYQSYPSLDETSAAGYPSITIIINHRCIITVEASMISSSKLACN